MPIGASAMLSSKLVKGAVLKVYPGGTHSLGDTHKEQLNADLLSDNGSNIALQAGAPLKQVAFRVGYNHVTNFILPPMAKPALATFQLREPSPL